MGFDYLLRLESQLVNLWNRGGDYDYAKREHRNGDLGVELPGYRIVKNFGIVRGIIVRSRSVMGNLGAALQTIVGGNITILTNLCEKTREMRSN